MKSLSAPHSAMPSDEKAFRGVVLVIDPQMGWLNRYTEPTIKRLHSFLLEDGILDKTIITVFYNNEDSNFRRLLSWWKGFTSEDDAEFIPDFKALNVSVFKNESPCLLAHRLLPSGIMAIFSGTFSILLSISITRLIQSLIFFVIIL